MNKIFNQYYTKENIPFILLSKNIHFPDDKKLYDKMYVSENIPWTILSYQIYKTINYWWVLSSLNKNAPFYAKKGTEVKFIRKDTLEEILKYI